MSKQVSIGEKYYIHSTIISFLLFLFYFLGIQNSFLYSSVLDYKLVKSDIFDGTVYPIEFVPNPIELTYEQRKQNYEQIDSKYFIKTPVYSPSIFQKDLESYKAGSEEYSQIMTQRLIFSVPYLGTYDYDFKEYTGSHPGVDIIAPEGTPVRNIASGLVVGVGYQAGGFGNYVLIKHSDITLSSGKAGTIYSLYAHLSKTLVNEGNKLKKAELIGLVGKSGTATTPHLHFQIDSETAPFSPYWPFSSTDMKTAGVGFFDGVNIGLGKENAILYTVNPLDFVNKNQSSVFLASLDVPEKTTEEPPQEVVIQTPKEEIKPEKIQEDNNKNIIIQEPQEIITYPSTQSQIKQDVVKKDVELLSSLNPEDILSGEVKVAIAGETNPILALNENDLEDLSSSFDKITKMGDEILQDDKNLDLIPQIEIEPEIETSTGIVEINDLVESTGSQKIFLDIDDDYKYLNELKYFKEKNIISGFSDNTFKPNNNITRVEALKVMLLANNIYPIKDLPSQFSDIKTNSWENTYINAGVQTGVVSIENKLFSPFRNVSRVEALKIILTLGKIDFSNLEKDLEFSDVREDDWFYDYVNYAVKNNLLVVSSNKFEPNKPITREELISSLYKYMIK